MRTRTSTARLLAALGAALLVTPGLATSVLAGPASAADPDPGAPLSTREKVLALDAGAHRGLTGTYGTHEVVEDSVLSAQHAVAEGARTVELDMRETSDHGCVAMHDASTGRTATADLVVARHTEADLSRLPLDGRNAGYVATCAQVLAALAPYRDRVHVEAELKDPDPTTTYLSRVAGMFRAYGFTGEAGNSRRESYYPHALLLYRHYDPSTPLDLITTYPVTAADTHAAGFDGSIVPYDDVVRAAGDNPHYLQGFADARTRLVPWEVDGTDRMGWVLTHSTMPRDPSTGEPDTRYGLAGFLSDDVDDYQQHFRAPWGG